MGTRYAAIVANNIRAELARNGWSQEELASKLGINRVTLNRRLRGQLPWTLEQLDQAAAAVGVPLAELLRVYPDNAERARRDSNPQPSDPDRVWWGGWVLAA